METATAFISGRMLHVCFWQNTQLAIDSGTRPRRKRILDVTHKNYCCFFMKERKKIESRKYKSRRQTAARQEISEFGEMPWFCVGNGTAAMSGS